MERNILKSERALLGLTQEELAGHLGVNRGTIVAWENDPQSMTVKNLLALSEFFGCTCDYLMGRTEVRK